MPESRMEGKDGGSNAQQHQRQGVYIVRGNWDGPIGVSWDYPASEGGSTHTQNYSPHNEANPTISPTISPRIAGNIVTNHVQTDGGFRWWLSFLLAVSQMVSFAIGQTVAAASGTFAAMLDYRDRKNERKHTERMARLAYRHEERMAVLTRHYQPAERPPLAIVAYREPIKVYSPMFADMQARPALPPPQDDVIDMTEVSYRGEKAKAQGHRRRTW